MYWRDVVTLKAVTEGRDADGFPKETITPPDKRVSRSR